MSSTPESVVKGWTDALNRHDPDAAAGYLAEGCVFTNTGNGDRFVSRAELRQHFVDLFQMWSDVHFETVKLFSAGDYFAKEWIMTGVHSGDVPGLPATGRNFRILGTGVGIVRDGKVVEVTEYWNFATFLAQVGLFPAAVG